MVVVVPSRDRTLNIMRKVGATVHSSINDLGSTFPLACRLAAAELATMALDGALSLFAI